MRIRWVVCRERSRCVENRDTTLSLYKSNTDSNQLVRVISMSVRSQSNIELSESRKSMLTGPCSQLTLTVVSRWTRNGRSLVNGWCWNSHWARANSPGYCALQSPQRPSQVNPPTPVLPHQFRLDFHLVITQTGAH